MIFRRKLADIVLALLTGASAAMLSAGTAQAATPATNPQASAAAAPAAEELTEVTVTGSRVITNGNDSPTPVTVVTAEEMSAVQPTTLSDQLNLLPQLQGSQTQSTSGTGIRNGAAAYVTLRNAGDNHTLVLWDGRRVQPTTSQESHASDVDINVIPQMLIQRTDLVTGGVSAVYGADAVTGVVNFITDTHFNGLKVNASTGVSDFNDDRQNNIGIAAGTSLFGGRGHVEGSYEYREDPGIFNRLSRPYFANPPGSAGNGTTIPFYRANNIRTGNQSFFGEITTAAGNPAALRDLQFAQNGILSPFVHGTLTGVTNQEIGGDGTWQRVSSLKASLKFNQGFGRFDYDFSDSLHGFLQGALTKSSQSNIGNATNLSLNIGYSNPFLNTIQQPYQATITAQRTANPNGSFAFQRTLENPLQLINTNTDYSMLVGGLSGSFGQYKWDVGLQHAVSVVKVRDTANIDNGRLAAAANAVTNSSGQIVCEASLSNAAYSDCVPLNLFGPTAASAAALQYITAQQTGSDARSEFDTFNGSITGAPVSTWAGPVNMAVSGEWRQLGYRLDSSTTPGDTVNCTGIRYSCTATTARWAQNTLFPRSRVAQRVSELAYEADVPLLKDVRLAQRFNLNGAARFTRYNTSGDVWTWKVGANWDVNDDLRFRGTRSRDIRAPNLNDLFNPPQPNISQRFDTHTNTTAQTQATSLPNPNLVPEKADTITAGFVYRPSFAPRLSMSVDAYHIKVNGAIIVISATSTQVQQACEASGGTSPLCDLFVRPAGCTFSNTSSSCFPTQMLGRPLNIAAIETEGADFEVNYAVGKLNLRTIASYQPHLIYDAGPAGLADIAGTAGGTIGYGNATTSPRIKVSLIARYDVTSNFNVTVLERWRNRLAANANSTLVYVQPSLPSMAYTNLNLSYNLKRGFGNTELYLNIQNLFNRFPDGVALNTGDDPFGRYFTAGLRLRMQ